MLVWAALIGLLGALATIGFRAAIHGLEWLATGHSGGLVEIAMVLPWYLRLAFPAVGGVVAGLLLELSKRWARAGASSDYMEAIAIGDGRISVRQALARSTSSLFSVVSGGSIGREGSMVHLAAMCASLTGRVARFGPARLRLLVACGAAAGITSAYSAPIGGALFVSEIVLGSIAMESFGPLVVASVVANITMRQFTSYAPPYQMPKFPDVAGVEVIAFLGLGLLAGIAAPLFLRVLDGAKSGFGRLKLPLAVRLGLGGLIVGLISVRVPEVWGNGYSVVNSLLHREWLWSLVLLVLGAKVVATASTTGSGAIGGVFTPTLFVGASLGLVYGQGLHAIWPDATSMPFAYAIVGMGAFLAGASHAPLMAILMIFEMTLSYQVVLPLMLACVAAYSVARAAREQSMYSVTIHKNQEESRLARWRGLSISELIKPAHPTVLTSADFAEVERAFVDHPVRYVYVVDEAGHFRGVVSLHEIKSKLLSQSGKTAAGPSAGELMRTDFLRLTAEARLGDAFQDFLTQRTERLPVVQSADDPRLLGVLSKTDLLLEIQRLTR